MAQHPLFLLNDIFQPNLIGNILGDGDSDLFKLVLISGKIRKILINIQKYSSH